MLLNHFWALFACDGRTHARTEDKPAQRDPLHALGTHPVCGRRPPTPIYIFLLSLYGYIEEYTLI